MNAKGLTVIVTYPTILQLSCTFPPSRPVPERALQVRCSVRERAVRVPGGLSGQLRAGVRHGRGHPPQRVRDAERGVSQEPRAQGALLRGVRGCGELGTRYAYQTTGHNTQKLY